MSIINTEGIVLPKEISGEIFTKAAEGSVISRLAKSQPQKFGTSDVMVFTEKPRAELVGEGAAKSPSTAGFTPKAVTPRKLQTTIRVNEEVLWADEDHQLGVIKAISEAIGESLARALDLVGIHGINPLTGEASASITDALVKSTNVVTAGADAEIDVETAAGLVIADHYSPDGVAFDTDFAWQLATTRYEDGRKKFPEIGLSNDMYFFSGLTAGTSSAVSGAPEIAIDSKLKAIVGQWDALKWGVQRDIKLRALTSGDPDGQGDLARNNQIALRAEIVYGIGVLDHNAFALVKSA